jgi:hypothetical protein
MIRFEMKTMVSLTALSAFYCNTVCANQQWKCHAGYYEDFIFVISFKYDLFCRLYIV